MGEIKPGVIILLEASIVLDAAISRSPIFLISPFWIYISPLKELVPSPI